MRHIKLHVYTDLTSSAAESCFSSSSMLANSSNRFSSAWSIAFSRCSFITVATRRILFSTSTYLQRKRSKIQYDAEVKYNVEIFCITFIIWEFEKNLPGSLPCPNDFKALNISHTLDCFHLCCSSPLDLPPKQSLKVNTYNHPDQNSKLTLAFST